MGAVGRCACVSWSHLTCPRPPHCQGGPGSHAGYPTRAREQPGGCELSLGAHVSRVHRMIAASGWPAGTRLLRIAAIRLGRSLSQVQSMEHDDAARTAADLGAAAVPPIMDGGQLTVLADILAGARGDIPPDIAEVLTSGLDLPSDSFVDADFDEIEGRLLRDFLSARGVVSARQCRGQDARTALLSLLDLIDSGGGGGDVR